MDTRRCLEILEIECVTSPEALKQAYRDMVQVWHPDRFHGNSRLEKLASLKLQDVNHAYNQLLTYFDPDQSQGLRTSSPPFQEQSSKTTEKSNSGIHSAKQTGNSSDAKDNFRDEQSGQNSHGNIYPAAKKSWLGKFIVLLVLCIFLVISGLIIYVIFNRDTLTSKSKEMASEAMEVVKTKLEKELATKIEGGIDIPKNAPPSQLDKSDKSAQKEPAEFRNYFEIHLDGGTVIMTESWWQEDDMIIYKQHGGLMGIEKGQVKQIVEKKATKSNLHF